jgi:hypothetical protein
MLGLSTEMFNFGFNRGAFNGTLFDWVTFLHFYRGRETGWFGEEVI